jgi:pimeloyl-ACP methyl ester carboxylesterase
MERDRSVSLFRSFGCLFCLAITALPASAQTARKLGALSFEPCTLSSEFGTQSLAAQCTSLRVPENPAAPEGRKISLAIAWLPATGEAEADPVFMIAGGPGQSARESFPALAQAFAGVRKKRDIVLVDQRGTGGSNKLACKDIQGKSAVSETEIDGPSEAKAFAARCAADLSKTADLRFYTTTDAVRDLDSVRRAIGAERINLYGVSYGTRVAQQYAKRYPSRLRTMTLDGVVPNSLALGNDHAKNLEASLDLQFARCAKDKICLDKLGEPRARLNALMDRLKNDPPTVAYRDAITGEAREEKLTSDHIATLARMFAYAPAIAALLPLQLNEAAHGRYEPLMALSRLLADTLGEQIMHGMQLSVVCAEDANELQIDPADVASLLGTEMIAALKAQCQVWPRGQRPADFRAPATGNLPTLILSGQFDPVTPPRYGEHVRQNLPNSRHLIVRGQGHNVLAAGCMPKLFVRFLDSADPKSLDAACIGRVPYTPPFTGFYGWEP